MGKGSYSTDSIGEIIIRFFRDWAGYKLME